MPKKESADYEVLHPNLFYTSDKGVLQKTAKAGKRVKIDADQSKKMLERGFIREIS